MSQDTASIRDQLGNNPEKLLVAIPGYYRETVYLGEGPLIAILNSTGHGWIVGSATNGIVGVNTATTDGLQQTVESEHLVDYQSFVINNNNSFLERFHFADLISTAETDADIDYTDGEVSFYG